MNAPLHLFEGHGIELEYMLVERNTLRVAPIADKVLQAAAGILTGEWTTGVIGWSNELVLHVIELKTDGPVPTLDDALARSFQTDVVAINRLAAEYGALLLPTAMHPTMDPTTQTVLWPHDNQEIYRAYDRVFGCQGHGWANLQSCHLNLPFGDAHEFGRLHAAIRPVLPLLPALAASSPLVEGELTGRLDSRLHVYASNQKRFPSIIGPIVPEAVFTPEEYRSTILAPMYRDIATVDPDGLLGHEWLNSRGAIARFDRHAIEIRLLDVQEAPVADLAIARLCTRVIRALAEEHWVPLHELQALNSGGLKELLERTLVDADDAVIDHEGLLRALGCNERRISAGEVWTHLFETLLMPELPAGSGLRVALNTILGHGPLARRIVQALGRRVTTQRIHDTYERLADCLAAGRMFR